MKSAAYYRDVDRAIIKAARSSQGIPTPENLSAEGGGPLPYTVSLIRERDKANSRVKNVLETTGAKYVLACSREVFDEELMSWGFARGKVRDAINKRLDERIGEVIARRKRIPNIISLTKEDGGPLPFAASTLLCRLNFNSTLRKKFDAKRSPSNPLAKHADALPVGVPRFGPRGRIVPENQPNVSEFLRRLRRP